MMPSEISKTEEDKYYITYMWNSSKKYNQLVNITKEAWTHRYRIN